jgi:soluble lytic murein transglycosylase-like protein
MDDLDALIQQVAEAHGLPWQGVKAIVYVESSFNPWAYRYEPHYQYLVGTNLRVTEQVGQQTSWGLMQVMGAVAREYGFTGWFPELCQPEVGLEYGCKHFKRYADRYGNWIEAIAAYNAGSPRKAGDQYVNQSYVDKVLRAWNQYDPMVSIKETEA